MLGRTLASLTLAVAAFGTLPAHDRIPGSAEEQPVLLRGGDLYTVAHGVLAGTDLLFADGRIARIGPALVPPPGTRIVDVAGQRVYPGLIAARTTIGLIEIGAVRATDDRAEVGSITPEAAAYVAYNPDSELIPTIRSHGITTVEVAPARGLIGGRSFIAHLDGWTHEDAGVERIAALHADWPAAELPRRWWRAKNASELAERRLDELRRLRQAFEQARAYHRERTANPEREIDARWEAMRPVLAHELPLSVLARTAGQIEQAVGFAIEQDVSLVIVGAREAWRVVDLLAEHDVPVILDTTSALPLGDDDGYDAVYRQPATLHEAGVRFALTHVTEGAWDVRNLPFHAGQAVAWGLPAEQALRSITLSAAEILGIDEDLGSLEPGKEATLFVSAGDVLDARTQRVTQMWIRGRPVDLGDRQRELYEKYRAKPAGPAPAPR
jgi:imidazolonepropionase-like amidohydrolase